MIEKWKVRRPPGEEPDMTNNDSAVTVPTTVDATPRRRAAYSREFAAISFTFICVATVPLVVQLATHSGLEMIRSSMWAAIITALSFLFSRALEALHKFVPTEPKTKLQTAIIICSYSIMVIVTMIASLTLAVLISSFWPSTLSAHGAIITWSALTVATLCQFFPMIIRAPDPDEPLGIEGDTSWSE